MDGEALKAIGRALADNLAQQDYSEHKPAEDWNFKWPWVDQGCVDFIELAEAGLAAYFAHLEQQGLGIRPVERP